MWLPRSNSRTVLPGLVVASLLSAAVLAQAPSSPDRPWPIPADAGARALLPENRQAVDLRKQYDLPALIDLAQRSNPNTRAAWEAAREAAAQVGLVESSYLPQLSLQAIGGFEHSPLPAPKRLVPAGYFVSNAREIIPGLAIKWLLFDFGRRDARHEAAQADSFVANVSFTAAHQELVYAVSRAYFNFGAAEGRLKAANRALRSALVGEDATRTKRANGLATVVALAQSERQSAQARYNVTQATGVVATARASLIATLGVPADVELEIADSSGVPLPQLPAQSVSAAIRDGLVHRPDVIASLGEIDAARAALEAERLAHRPVVQLGAHVFQNIGRVRSQGEAASNVNKTGANLLLSFSLPLFDGGERASRVDAASAKVRRAEANLVAKRDAAANQVVKAHNDLITSLAQYDAALTVGRAADVAYDAARRSYEQGVGTYTDFATEENAVAQAEAQLEDARAAAHTAAAGLAFAMGAINGGHINQ